MNLTDTHCHLDLARFDADRSAVLERARAVGVRRILNPSLDVRSSRHIVQLVASQPDMYAAIGIHPTEITKTAPLDLSELRELAERDRVVAIGEVGLDYFWVKDSASRTAQRAALQTQLRLAEATSKPVVLHLREQGDQQDGDCGRDMLAILTDWARPLRREGSDLANRCGVLHSFSGSLDLALSAIELGFFIGISGPITYPSANNRREIVRQLPMERLLIETDAPFLAPQSHRGKRNEPAYVKDIADRIASVQSRTRDEVANFATSNAARLFAWGEPD